MEIACDGRSYELPIDDILRANLIPDWEREFARKNDRGDAAGDSTVTGENHGALHE